MNKEKIVKNLQKIKENIDAYSPYPDKVVLLAVTKMRSVDAIKYLYELGIRDFGENKVQEFLKKYEELKNYKDIRWHFIGHLQTNKIKYIVDKIFLLHSLDRLRLIEKLNEFYKKKGKRVDTLIEVNFSREPQKYGIYKEELPSFIRFVKKYSFVNVQGIMTMAPYTDDMQLCSKIFTEARDSFFELKKELPGIKYLSMGMSNDYIEALKCGANIIRIGTALFE